MNKLFLKHVNNPNPTVQQHREHLFDLINKCVSPRIKIYLDTNFWIRFRDVELKRNLDSKVVQLYEAVKHNVNQGNYICPVSAEALSEMSRQKDSVTKLAMCQVMDSLSAGTCIRNHQERFDLEIKEAVHLFIKSSSVPKAKQFVWTKVPFVFGHFVPNTPGLPKQIQIASAKANLDFLYSMRISEMIRVMDAMKGEYVFGDMDYEAFAEKLNSNKQKFLNENKSFRQMFKAELRGSIEGALPRIRKNLEELFVGTNYQGKEITPIDVAPLAVPFANGLFAGVTKGKLKDIIPSLAIPARLHATIRWNKTQKYKPNDFNDVFHTSAAIGYYDIYFTESGFRSVSEQAKLDQFYPIQIYSDPVECIKAFYTNRYK